MISIPETNDTGFLNKYGITHNEYLGLLAAQDNSCAVCEVPAEELERRLAVDHCHITGAVRGLLCTRCNMGLGYFRDRSEVLRKAAEYLELRS